MLLNCGAQRPFFSHLAISQARRMSDCSSCTWPPCLAIVADMLKSYKKFVAASHVRISRYLNHIRLRTLLQCLESMFGPFPGSFITKFVCEKPRTDHIVMFAFAHCVDMCLGRPRKSPGMGSNESATKLSTDHGCALICSLTFVYIGMDWLTSDWMLLPYLAASSFMYHCWMGILGDSFSGYNWNVAVNWPPSELLLCPTGWRIRSSACRLARFGFNRTWLKYFWSDDLLLWNGEEDDHHKQWEVLKII